MASTFGSESLILALLDRCGELFGSARWKAPLRSFKFFVWFMFFRKAETGLIDGCLSISWVEGNGKLEEGYFTDIIGFKVINKSFKLWLS